jgi:HemY protein
MIRLVLFFVLLGLVAFGLTWLANHPGDVGVTWQGVHVETSVMAAMIFVLAFAILLGIAWTIIRLIFRLPSLYSFARRSRRREKGLTALSHGMVAVGAGDSRAARKHALEAQRLIGDEPLAKLLRAQAAQLSGDRTGAERAFKDMLDSEQTHALGLRGLHLEARRRGDHALAHEYALRANAAAPLPWAGQAVLDHRALQEDWSGALATVESNADSKLIDRPTANRWRAVLKTAMALERAEKDAKGALALAQEALKLAPDLVPAAALAGRLMAEGGDYRRASRAIEAAYAKTPHPDLAAAYLRMRRGDSAADRLARAKQLVRVAPFVPESRLTIARASLDARDFAAARAALSPLLNEPSTRPTARVCLLMAEIEETQAAGDDAAAEADGAASGMVREWLGRAARAPRDPAWIADGIVYDRWAPASPTTGHLDAFEWRAPRESLSAPEAPMPPAPAPAAKPAPIPPPPIPLAAAAPEPPAVAAAPPPVAAPPPPEAAPTPTPPERAAPHAPDDPGPPPRKGYLYSR